MTVNGTVGNAFGLQIIYDGCGLENCPKVFFIFLEKAIWQVARGTKCDFKGEW